MTRVDPRRLVRRATPERASVLTLYSRVSDEVASRVIRRYSTSFGLASRLLGAGMRQHVENVYALVRVADEIVDGGAVEAGMTEEQAREVLDELEHDTERAMASGYSANVVVHAFARTAREAGFGTELTRPFFASMRMDLDRHEHDDASFAEYVYGSAEVVGLMCLRVFLRGRDVTADDDARLVHGARRLGAAFQKVNFLRDLAADYSGLRRSYFPGIDPSTLTEDEKVRLLDDIDDDLAASAAVVPDLPPSARRAVAAAQELFTELSRRLRATPASELVRARVRVPDPVKARIALRAGLGRLP